MTRLENKTPAANSGHRGLFKHRSLSVELAISLVAVGVVGAILLLLYNRQSDLWYRQLQTKAEDMLMRLGYEVQSVASGEAAIDYVRRQSMALLLLDMIMEPGIDRLETYRRIIDFSPGQRAVITSGFSESERVQETRRLGASAYVKKTYRLETLARAVKSVLEDT